ncbi:carbohydrate porin [Pontixanthobacter aestiaquae]|uniref:Porin n=1 Tax=Pontixanthobacter aestiaquae TaxID=1509367 RepID=A0A844Z3Z9_9SPHN|nr:carbohydrate porin [Pontixanthobacter aestiaquae]MDN3645592.1 carbohydrate porin [Pontixanthobacter aestiaquae]MXO83411.1 hypothetical protein [Pontixanthobacter aestiaquae]
MKFVLSTVAAAALLIGGGDPAFAGDEKVEQALAALEARLNAVEAENRALRAQMTTRDTVPVAVPATPVVPIVPIAAHAAQPPLPPVPPARSQDSEERTSRNTVGVSSDYAYRMLDHAENTNTKAVVQLEAITEGLLDDRVVLSGSATAIATYQRSNTPDKFGYLMRNPTSANQIGKSVTEAVLHSAQLAVTARITDDVTAYAELLYDPQQSFGPGTITALTRNQIQLRRGWVMLGNLEKSPVYALIGKMDTPFGLQDTVSPFTNSTNWHAFAGLAYGAQVGLKKDGLLLRAMAIQGGAQFRSANTSVNGTNVPSKLNNFAVDGRYTLALPGNGNSVMAGGSYQHGSPYCQQYPIFHFNPCDDNVPAWAAYGKVNFGDLSVIGEFARTTKVWPGSQVPDPTNPLSQFEAQKTEAFTVGSRFAFGQPNQTTQRRNFALSAEFSKFTAGAEGAPWERQNQAVLGLSWFPIDNLNVFGEVVHVDGFAPLNFLSGGNLPGGATWSDRDAATDVALIGAQVAF